MRQLIRTTAATLSPVPSTPGLHIHDVARMRRRVTLADLDVLMHMNNASYLSIMDLGRYDLLRRSGVLAVFRQRGWFPVIANQMISYRRSLGWRQVYTLETRIAGYDERSVYLEQRFVRDDEVCALAFVHGRLRKRTGGAVTAAELTEATGVDVLAHRPPQWLTDWAENSTLPSAREPYPSVWN